MKKHVFWLLIITCIALFCMKALFHEGLFTAHDIWHQVARLYWYNESVKAHVFPPSWIAPLANGFGYPLFVFSYHFPWMIGILFLKLGFSIPEVIKILFIISFIVSGWGMYLFVFLTRKKIVSSLVSSVLYMVAPWRFVTIFVSAAMGRAFVFALFPFIAIGVYILGKTNLKKTGVLVLSLSYTALILSHAISAITSLAVVLPLVLIYKPKLKHLIFAALITLLLTSWYILPIVKLGHSIQANTEPFHSLYSSQFIDFKQLLYSRWGYGIVNLSAKEGAFSYQLGFALWLVIVCTIASLLVRRTFAQFALLSFFVISVVMMLDVSKPVWEALSHITTLDYPTMFMIPAVFLSAFMYSLLFKKSTKLGMFVGVFLLILTFVNNRNYMRVNQYVDNSVESIVAAETTTNTFHEYLPLGSNVNMMAQNDVPDIESNKLINAQVLRQTNSFEAFFETNTDQYVILKVFAFPGIRVFINGKPAEYKIDSSGRILISIRKGSNSVLVLYKP